MVLGQILGAKEQTPVALDETVDAGDSGGLTVGDELVADALELGPVFVRGIKGEGGDLVRVEGVGQAGGLMQNAAAELGIGAAAGPLRRRPPGRQDEEKRGAGEDVATVDPCAARDLRGGGERAEPGESDCNRCRHRSDEGHGPAPVDQEQPRRHGGEDGRPAKDQPGTARLGAAREEGDAMAQRGDSGGEQQIVQGGLHGRGPLGLARRAGHGGDGFRARRPSATYRPPWGRG